MNGIYFNGAHSSDFDCVWKTNSRPFLPIQKRTTETWNEIDGVIDNSLFNSDGRTHYEERIFSGLLTVKKATNLSELQIRFSKIANWLLSEDYAHLVFDDMPTTVWEAKVTNLEQVSYELSRLGKATINFTVKPFSQTTLDIHEGVILDSKTIISENIPLDTEVLYLFELEETQNSITVKNLGDWHTKPIIKVTGAFSSITIKKDDTKKIRYFGGCEEDDEIIFDFGTSQIEKNGVLDNTNSLGIFWDFVSGNNAIQVILEGSGTPTATLDFYMKYYFLYGAVIK